MNININDASLTIYGMRVGWDGKEKFQTVLFPWSNIPEFDGLNGLLFLLSVQIQQYGSATSYRKDWFSQIACALGQGLSHKGTKYTENSVAAMLTKVMECKLFIYLIKL